MTGRGSRAPAYPCDITTAASATPSMDAGFWIGVLAGVSVLLALVLWSARRHRSPKLVVECDEGIERLMTSLAGLTLGMAVGGNRLEVLENGHFFDVLVERIGQARHTVHFESFLWKEGE